MSSESDNLPPRQLSGRRSKPSMDLLIDNQRILSHLSEPVKRKRIIKKPKLIEDDCSLSNKSSTDNNISLLLKLKPKKKNTVKTIKSPGKNVTSENDITKTLVVHLEIDKNIENNKPKRKTSESDSDDDIPIAEMYPDIIAKTTTVPDSESIRQQTQIEIPSVKSKEDKLKSKISLPPKKKIKLINEFNGSSNSKSAKKNYPNSVSNHNLNSINNIFVNPESHDTSNNTSQLTIQKTNILSLPKIPKKVNQHNGNASPVIPVKRINTELTNSETSPENIPDGEKIEDIEYQAVKSIKIVAKNICIRELCTKPSIDNFQWDNEFCSADCAVLFSKNYYKKWLLSLKNIGSSATTISIPLAPTTLV